MLTPAMGKDKEGRKRTVRNRKVNRDKPKNYESRDDNVVKKD